ncbi:MAG: histidine phosphatase family protein [Clostridiales bacterium]|nr:histidine phosphatase family protein [Candidatus Blautia equi]
MRLLFIRHGDPDYVHDTLTEKGHREAKLLSEIIEDLHIDTAFQSPLGRAQHTAAYSLKKLGITAATCPWLQEFPAHLDINGLEELQKAYPDTFTENDRFRHRIVWDAVPGYWLSHPEYSTPDGWRDSEVSRHSDMIPVYDDVVQNFDKLLAEHGYVRDGKYYRVEKESEETLTFFCHFGVTCVLLAHMWNISPFILWHSLAMAPTSVTEVVTEEREQGIAYFRALRIGDTAHLYTGKEETSFACRFCETYSNTEQRH